MNQKYSFLIFIFVFLVACSVQTPVDEKLNISENITVAEANQTKSNEIIQINTSEEIKAENKEETKEKIPKLNLSSKHDVPAHTKMSARWNYTTHTIEVIDVTEDGSACFINVDGSMVLIDKDSSKEVNGITIHVFDVRVMRSQLQNNDICELMIG